MSIKQDWEKEFEKRWNTCQWSEKDGLHPEAFLIRASEDGEEDSYDKDKIKDFISQELNRQKEELVGKMKLERIKAETFDIAAGLSTAIKIIEQYEKTN